MFDFAGETYLTSLETAQRLGITHASLRTYRSDQRSHIPFIKLSAAVLYKKSDVDAHLRGRGRS